jgi:hypothetical protein
MADTIDKKTVDADVEAKDADVAKIDTGDVAVLPTGSVDPVYEAKAKVLNRAVWMPLIRDY